MKLILFLSLVFIISCKDTESSTDPIIKEEIEQPNPKTESSDTIFPVDNYSILQNFGEKNSGFNGKYHCADDVVASAGTPIKAMTKGIVSYSGPMGGYGWLIIIDHDQDSVYSLYGHLSTRREKVSKGDEVIAAQVIAYAADDDEDGSGPRDGSGTYIYWRPHLHFSIRKGKLNDYPLNGDDRWMAGYTTVTPTSLGWMDPSDYINSKK